MRPVEFYMQGAEESVFHIFLWGNSFEWLISLLFRLPCLSETPQNGVA